MPTFILFDKFSRPYVYSLPFVYSGLLEYASSFMYVCILVVGSLAWLGLAVKGRKFSANHRVELSWIFFHLDCRTKKTSDKIAENKKKNQTRAKKQKKIFRQIVLDFCITAKPSYAYFATQNDIDFEKKICNRKAFDLKKSFHPTRIKNLKGFCY